MITFLLACVLIYVLVLCLMGLFVFCVYVNHMFIASCEDIKGYFKK